MEDEAEYAAFVTERWSALVRTAVFLGAAPHEAEDLAQATLLLCYRKWRLVRSARVRDGYVYRMLMNVLRSDRRSASDWRRMTWGPKARSVRVSLRSRQIRSGMLSTIATGMVWCSRASRTSDARASRWTLVASITVSKPRFSRLPAM